MKDLFAELKRRNIFKVGLAYLIAAWLLLQVAALFASSLDLPGLVMRIFIFFVVLGFPLALIFAWAFEITPDGLKRAHEVHPDHSIAADTGRKLNYLIIGVLSLAVLVLLVDRIFLLSPSPSPALEPQAVQVAEVPEEETSADERPDDEEGQPARFNSIAVLPFTNMSSDPEQDYFSDGISEELLNLLAKTDGLKVAARTSSFSFREKDPDIKEIGERLDVSTVLEGSVRKSAAKLRITAQLIDVKSGYHLWSETYDRELTDIFEIQDEISAAIVAELSRHLDIASPDVGKSSRGDIAAYDLYLKGRKFIGVRNKESIETALEYFSQAIALDGNFAPAFSGMADAYILLADTASTYGNIPAEESLVLAEPLVERALAIDPGLAEAYATRGLLRGLQLRRQEAVDDLTRAIELRPSYAIAHMWLGNELNDFRRIYDAHKAYVQAATLDPLSAVIAYNLARSYQRMGDLEAMEDLSIRLERLAPNDDYSAIIRAVVAESRGEYAQALKQFLAVTNEGDLSSRGALLLTRLYSSLGVPRKALSYAEPLPSVAFYAFANQCEKAARLLDGLKDKWQEEEWFGYGQVDHAVCRGDFEWAATKLDSFTELDYELTGPFFYGHPDTIIHPMFLLVQKEGWDEKHFRQEEAKLLRYLERIGWSSGGAVGSVTRAKLAILNDKPDAALALLKSAHKRTHLAWYWRYDPILSGLSGRQDYGVIFDQVDAHVNQERAKLGWEPLNHETVWEE